jgi:predicted phosphoribosyltransferase
MAALNVLFADRADAGRQLADRVRRLSLTGPLLILGLPRGGVPVAYEVARALGGELDVLAVRKVGMPGQPELAIGALASGGIVVRDPAHREWAPVLSARFEQLAQRERAELERRETAFRGGMPPLDLHGRTVVLVDDGLATGATMVAAIRAARKAGAERVVVAAPVASVESAALVAAEADEVAIVRTPPLLFAIGDWYRDFAQVDDAEVRRLLARAHASVAGPAGSAGGQSIA